MENRADDPVRDRPRKGLARVVLAIFFIIAATFVGYNVYYLLTAG